MSDDEAEVTVGSFPLGEISGDPKEVMRRIREAMEGLSGGGSRVNVVGLDSTAPDPAEALGMLTETYSRYVKSYGSNHGAAHCPFAPGDIITPVACSIINNVGEPHIVLETREITGPDFDNYESGPGSSTFGRRAEMRVACAIRSRADGSMRVVAHWCESFEFVLYDR